jgi:hypothetical protein
VIFVSGVLAFRGFEPEGELSRRVATRIGDSVYIGEAAQITSLKKTKTRELLWPTAMAGRVEWWE